MRFLILKDTKISKSGMETLQKDFTDFIKQHTDITPEFYIEERDYSNVPTEADSDGDLKPTKAYFKAMTDEVYAKYGTWGVDSVVMLVHRDNWIFDGIWGTNLSNVYRQYHLHLCRFDHRNPANSLGTLYHEWMHSLDALIKTHTGVEIDDLFKNTTCFADWDSTVVHGNRFRDCKDTPFAYIRWKDNAEVLPIIAPHLRNAYRERRELFLEPLKQVQRQIISWLRSLINRKKGVPRGT
jgi:hypothetical protein